ncbi:MULTISPECIES: serine hydrolase [Asticcacaulis]|uniref:serine hydrolase domain-containing protein n=1 Tax=Asticcacaulis TaxID=76890 RepID=UPI001AEABB3E|nr:MULTISPECIES: serine hydrolase domain-containing protein [Asticcacaulis]MBP2158183.1 CubicO group peptidase (beta-lactamase class C family) [Asticcacaulis solisilvae]MDR6799228.1 CubicO group peptidase (beta-lactamase class C family) [Asticcacaulis sp. BE141]
MAGKSSIRFGAGMALFLSAVSAFGAELPADTVAKIDAAAQTVIAINQTPSAQIAVVKDGEIVYSKAFGVASIDGNVKATTKSRYQIASVSKAFTAAAVLALVEDGKLSLDDTVSKWLPDLTSADQITVRQLISHTSGYSDYWPQDYVMETVTKPTTAQKIANTYAKAPLDYKPGDEWQYSNTGYVVAGLIVEKVSGKPLFDFMQDRILKPIGIHDALDAGAVDLKAPDALGYQRQGLGPNRLTPLAGRNWTFAAWPLILTAEDVARWDISILKKSLFTPATYDEQVKTIKLNNGNDTGYAMGWFVRKTGGRTIVSHTGEGAGYLTSNRIYPDDGIAIVVLTNTMSGNAFSEISDRIAFQVLPQHSVDAQVLATFKALQAGQADRAHFTGNFNAYLTDKALADHKQYLGALGDIVTFQMQGSSKRGGMDIRSYRLRAGEKLLSLSVFVTKDGKFDQFLVSAVN